MFLEVSDIYTKRNDMKIQVMKTKTYVLTMRQAKLFLMNLPANFKVNLIAGDLWIFR